LSKTLPSDFILKTKSWNMNLILKFPAVIPLVRFYFGMGT